MIRQASSIKAWGQALGQVANLARRSFFIVSVALLLLAAQRVSAQQAATQPSPKPSPQQSPSARAGMITGSHRDQ